MTATYILKSGLVDAITIEGYEVNDYEAAEIVCDQDGARCAVFLEPIERTEGLWTEEQDETFREQVREIARELDYGADRFGDTYSLIFDPARDQIQTEPIESAPISEV